MSAYIKTIHTNYLKIHTSQMMEVDRLMIEEYHVDLIQMMENAGRCLAILTKERFFNGDVQGKRIVIMAGTGGNGGGALVAARRLHNWGAQVKVFTTAEFEKFTPIPLHQFKILKRMGVSIQLADEINGLETPDAILDGIIGYSLKGKPHGFAAGLIHWANSQNVPIVALDTPSGLNPTDGTLYDPILVAAATLTLAMPKKGLFAADARSVVGELYVGDISVPSELYQEESLGLQPANIFRFSDIVRLF